MTEIGIPTVLESKSKAHYNVQVLTSQASHWMDHRLIYFS